MCEKYCTLSQRLIEREFDLLNRVSRVKQGSDIVSTMEFLGRSYRLASKGYQNGDLVKYLYDQGRRLTSSETKNKNQAILQSFGWGYDALDLKSFEKRLHSGGKGDAFSYDALKRLTNVTFDSPTPETPGGVGVKSRAITLDKLDNILKITDNENAMVTEIIGELEGKGKALNQYSKFNDLPLEYDTNGNLSAKGSRLFAYDYRNRLVRSSKGDDAVTFTYDIFGRQTSRTDISGTQNFFYAGDQKIEERNASGQVTKQYVWGNSIDELLRLDIYNGSSSTPYYVHTDNIGSTTAITDSSGNLVERVTYDVYGLPTFTDALGQTLKKSTIRNTTLFQGREYDYDLGLYNYRARYFDPTMGRFLQTDPLGYQDSMNLYQGMGMNPVNFVDPRGKRISSNTLKYWGSYDKALEYVKYNLGLYLAGGDSLGRAYDKLVRNGLVTEKGNPEDISFALSLLTSPTLDVFNVTPEQFAKDVAGGAISSGTGLINMAAKGLSLGNPLSWKQIDQATNYAQNKINQAIGANPDSLGYWIGSTYAPVVAGGVLDGASATAVDSDGLANLTSNLSKDHPVVVVGESMARVEKTAERLRSIGYGVKTYNPRSFTGLNRKTIEANRSWLSYWVKEKGANVIDIGRQPGRETRSPFYLMETRSLYRNWKYKNVFKFNPGY